MSDWLITFMGDGVLEIAGVGIFQRYTTAAVNESVVAALAGDDRWRIRGPAGETEAPGVGVVESESAEAEPPHVLESPPGAEPEPESERAPEVRPKSHPTPKGDAKPGLRGDSKTASRGKPKIRSGEDAKPGR